jgi:4-diphosphocytidyl-2-C-methyl-D-erythritol kinase
VTRAGHAGPAAPAYDPEAPAGWSGAAPAKVNLFLRIVAREAGGYHQLETLFQALELEDRVSVSLEPVAGAVGSGERASPAPEGGASDGLDPAGAPGPLPVHLEVTGVLPGALGPPHENLVVRAARVLLEALPADHPVLRLPEGERPGVRIVLEKAIPHGAGLGGGSSDAATVLVGLNQLLGSPLDRSRLVRLGGTLGADVPFFVTEAPLALAWGRGDRLLPLPALPRAAVLLALPPWGMATPGAYGRLARLRERSGAGDYPGSELHEFLAEGGRGWGWEDVARRSDNQFEAALFPDHPELVRIHRALVELGATPARLSGSGSALFGVFPDVETLPAALEAELREAAGVDGLRTIRTTTRG